VPIAAHDAVIDPSAGKNRVFIKNVRSSRKLYCETDEGSDFLVTAFVYDWAITNPAYHLLGAS
jgi:hypothetical protein